MIKVTSDAANKLIKKLEQEKGILTDKISKMSTFIVAITENYDQIKAEQEAEFNLNETISQIDEIDKKIITIRHAKSVFNNSVVMKNVQNRISVKGTLTKRVYLLPKMQMQNYITFVMINMDINCF